MYLFSWFIHIQQWWWLDVFAIHNYITWHSLKFVRLFVNQCVFFTFSYSSHISPSAYRFIVFHHFPKVEFFFLHFRSKKTKLKPNINVIVYKYIFEFAYGVCASAKTKKKKIFINKDNGYEHLKMFEARKLDWIFWISKEIKKNGTNIWNRQTNEKKKNGKKRKGKILENNKLKAKQNSSRQTWFCTLARIFLEYTITSEKNQRNKHWWDEREW